jgi:hypothetical protein
MAVDFTGSFSRQKFPRCCVFRHNLYAFYKTGQLQRKLWGKLFTFSVFKKVWWIKVAITSHANACDFWYTRKNLTYMQLVNKMCSHCLFPVVHKSGTSCYHVVKRLMGPTDSQQIVPTSRFQKKLIGQNTNIWISAPPPPQLSIFRRLWGGGAATTTTCQKAGNKQCEHILITGCCMLVIQIAYFYVKMLVIYGIFSTDNIFLTNY